MRFCLVSTQQHWGGGEALLLSLGTELSRLGHSISCIVRQGGEVQQQVIAAGTLVLHAMQDRGSNVSDWWAIRRALRHWSPDVVVLNDTHAVPLAGSASWCCRQPRPVRLAIKHTIFRLHSPLKYRLLCDKLVCVSHAALETVLAGGLPPRHATVIHGGCPLAHPRPQASGEVRRELGLSDDQLLLVAVGSLLDCKGHRELVAAVEQLSRSDPRLVALIAGEGEQRPALEQQIGASGLTGRVRLLGYRRDAQRLLDAADIVVHPSHAEGLSLVLIQAQMLGKPIVATPVGGAREVLAAGTPECTAWLAQPHDASSLAEQIALACRAVRAGELPGSPPGEWSRRLAATAARMRAEFTVAATAANFAELAAALLEPAARLSSRGT